MPRRVVITSPTVANISRNAAATIKFGKLHEPAVLRLEQGLRSGPILVTEFDGLSIGDAAIVSEVKRRSSNEDITSLVTNLAPEVDSLKERSEYLETDKPKKLFFVIFHSPTVDPGTLRERLSDGVEVVAIPTEYGKLSLNVDRELEDVVFLAKALFIEFFSLQRLTCEEFPISIGCFSPPYDAIFDDLKAALNDKRPATFARRLADSAADPERLRGLHPCQALYALGAALRISGRRRSYKEVLEEYRESVEYVSNFEFFEGAIEKYSRLLAEPVMALINVLDGERDVVKLPLAQAAQQPSVRVRCIKEKPRKLAIFADTGFEDASLIASILLNSFGDSLEKIYAYENALIGALNMEVKKRALRVVVEKRDLRELPNDPDIYLFGTDLAMSYKRTRRIVRDINDRVGPRAIMIFHRGLMPTDYEKRHNKGRHSLEVARDELIRVPLRAPGVSPV